MILNGDTARPADMGAAIIRVYTNQYDTGQPQPKELPTSKFDFDMVLRPTEKVMRAGWENYVELAVALKSLVEIEKEIEEAKISLSVKFDFTTLDLFRLFEAQGKVTRMTLTETLSQTLKWVEFTQDDIYLWLRQNDLSNVSGLDYD